MTGLVITIKCGVWHSFQRHQFLWYHLVSINELSW